MAPCGWPASRRRPALGGSASLPGLVPGRCHRCAASRPLCGDSRGLAQAVSPQGAAGVSAEQCYRPWPCYGTWEEPSCCSHPEVPGGPAREHLSLPAQLKRPSVPRGPCSSEPSPQSWPPQTSRSTQKQQAGGGVRKQEVPPPREGAHPPEAALTGVPALPWGPSVALPVAFTPPLGKRVIAHSAGVGGAVRSAGLRLPPTSILQINLTWTGL